MESLGERSGEVDLAVFRRPAVRDMFREDLSEAVRYDSKGLACNAQIGVQDWGFDLADVTAHVDVWHGELDGTAPVELAQYVVEELPNGTGHYRADAGDLLMFDYRDEILSTLVTEADNTDITASNS